MTDKCITEFTHPFTILLQELKCEMEEGHEGPHWAQAPGGEWEIIWHCMDRKKCEYCYRNHYDELKMMCAEWTKEHPGGVVGEPNSWGVPIKKEKEN